MYLRDFGHSFKKQWTRKYRQKQNKEYFQFSGHHNSRGRGEGGVVVSFEMGRDARREIQIIPLSETNVGVAQA